MQTQYTLTRILLLLNPGNWINSIRLIVRGVGGGCGGCGGRGGGLGIDWRSIAAGDGRLLETGVVCGIARRVGK